MTPGTAAGLSWGAIAAVVGVGSLLAVVGGLLVRAVLAWASETSRLRVEIANLRNELTELRGSLRLEMLAKLQEQADQLRDMVDRRMADHRESCPAKKEGA